MSDHVLVVDDDELVRSGLAGNLKREGFRVSTAASGEQAIEILSEHRVDLTLCDIVLGDRDGLEMLKVFQHRWPHMAVVMITGHGSVNSALEALKGGAADYIQKPAKPEDVINRIRSVLDAARMRHTLSLEHRQAETKRREEHEQLIRTERMMSLGMLAEGAANDLGNILAPILKPPAGLKKQLAGNKEALTYVAEIEEAARRAAAVLHDLQTIGQGGRYEKKPVHVNKLIEHFMKSEECERLKSSNARARLQLNLAESVPAITGSAERLTEVIANLVANAYESLPTGGVITVETAFEQIPHPVGRYGSGKPGEYAIVSVHDTGGGMKREDIERIFEPFYLRKVMGRRLVSGLGLALVYRVIEDHGGFIDIKTRTGEGTRFILYLPVAAPSEQEPIDLRADYTGHETILVVDDYEEQRKVAAGLLRDLGYDVVMADSGRAAVHLCQTMAGHKTGKKIDLVVLDLVLGDEFDGVETYKKIILMQPGQKAILVSGFADIARIVEARKLGIRQCIRKPYTTDTLGRAVRQELDSA